MFVTICTSFLLISRALYNILAITIDKLSLPDFNFDWINVSDQVSIGKFGYNYVIMIKSQSYLKADFVNLTETNKYISFVLVILIWELIPTLVVIILFKIKRPSGSNETLTSINSYANVRKSVFLDDDTERGPAEIVYDQNWMNSNSQQSLIDSTNRTSYSTMGSNLY